MKFIPVILATLATAVAASSDPGETALHFLEKVRARKINLEPGGDTALSPQTSTQKRKEIARRLERLARDLGTDPLELGATKTDDDLAAVLVRKTGGFDPSRLQVFPVALVKRGNQWAAAPVPASFENSGVGYATALRQRLATLEDWMLREQATDLQNLRDQSAERMRRKISESLPPETLRGFTSKQAAERFLTACERRNLPEICGLLGGLATTLPDDWSLRLKAAEAAVAALTATNAATQCPHPWRLLIAGEVIRIPIHHEEDGDSAAMSLACLDPAGNPPRFPLPQIELMHLDLAKDQDGLWRIDPPEALLQTDVSAEQPDHEDADPDLLDAFPGKLAALCPPTFQPTAERARDALLESLRSGNPITLMPLIELGGKPSAVRNACLRAAQVWWALREPASVGCALPLAWRQDPTRAATACQFFSARNPDRMDLEILYFEKSDQGWCWTPEPRPEPEKSFREWTELQSNRWHDEWHNAILTDCQILEKLPDSGPLADADSRRLIESWLKATRAGDVMAALRLTVRLNLPDSPATLLRNLGYDMTASRRNPHPPTLADIHHGNLLAAVGVQTDADNTPSFPLYPVVATPTGPRILLEIDLFAAGNRSRDFLNRTALDRLRKASPEAAEDLATLYANYQAKVAPPAPATP